MSLINKNVEVAKTFRNCHQPKAWIEQEGIQKPQLPSMVRWNSPVKLLDWFVAGWQKLRKIVEEHPEYFNGPGKSIAKTKDLCIFQQIEDAKKCVQPVAETLDTIQGNKV